MSQSEPVWYDALREEPLGTPGFKEELKLRICSRAALLSPAAPKRKVYKPLLAVVLLLCLTASLWKVLPRTGLAPWDHRVPQQIVLQPTVAPEERVIQPQDQEGAPPPHASVGEGRWQELVDAQFPESRNELFPEQAIDPDQRLVFAKRMYESGEFWSVSLSAFIFTRDKEGAWSLTSAYMVADPGRDKTNEELVTSRGALGDVPVFMGAVLDESIDKVVVKDAEGREESARIIPGRDGMRFWYLSPEGRKGPYKVEGLTQDGRMVSERSYY